MDNPGQKLKRARERLKLKYRDVEEASQRIAEQHADLEYAIALSRLSDIENKGTVPTIFRLYSLCAIYRLDLTEVLNWYGVRPEQLPAEASRIGLDSTHLTGFQTGDDGPGAEGTYEIEPAKTTFVGQVQRWGKLSATMLHGFEPRNHRLGYIGLEDWFMYPLLQPGSLVIIDGRYRKIATHGWSNEFERPIYFFEHRGGYSCAWCAAVEERLVLQPPPASACAPAVYRYPNEIEVIGQVVGVAMLLDSRKQRRARPATVPAVSPGH
jgi:transcriptional regulator with XRE-family HTH domain